ncbi:type II toxin-antitoxin system RelE family toxin [Stenomitos frigidus]|uniref:Type II toxin-antitoxin system RelE/ParE family toxin n=1 Tax=Stenomitos frigidus ULC18 TaxID=2107698 RepID=A0A2T1E034_9CYAN|nr:type II toxin-antitoxin system RelE/ParE family toxin [Stenomitos frigidus]PSB26041.1 type II toxin-antitoxin system RelE/ParE family toxin [Stenomitos frigidus ULC18]
MELVLSKAAVKFLERLSLKETEKLQDRLATLLRSLETEGIIPFNELDIKSLKGDWKGFFRMRVGKVRVVFTIDSEADALQVYDIDFRGSIYKSLLLGSTTITLPLI